MADETLDVAPTRGNLLRLQDNLERIRNGHDLLDRKREVLLQELTNRIAEAEALEQKAREQFQAAYDAMRRARMRMGTDRVRWISLRPTADVQTDVQTRSIMGARVPVVQVDIAPHARPYGPGGTSATLDEARERWLELVRSLGELVESTTTVWRLARELRKTQRRVNALENIIIPRYENTVSSIEQALEEEAREEIVHAKKVKELHGRA
jgi:V/A-type H+-transporting ATPase subunit D